MSIDRRLQHLLSTTVSIDRHLPPYIVDDDIYPWTPSTICCPRRRSSTNTFYNPLLQTRTIHRLPPSSTVDTINHCRVCCPGCEKYCCAVTHPLAWACTVLLMLKSAYYIWMRTQKRRTSKARPFAFFKPFLRRSDMELCGAHEQIKTDKKNPIVRWVS